MILGLTAMLSLAISSLSMASMTKERVVALNLAREGIEITRAIRDTHWLRDDLCWNADTECGLKSGVWTFDYHTHFDAAYCFDDSICLTSLTFSDTAISTYGAEQIATCDSCALVQNPVSASALDTQILYSHSATGGTPIIYRRVIKIENIPPIDPDSDPIKHVTSLVWWTAKGRDHTLQLETYLTNWR